MTIKTASPEETRKVLDKACAEKIDMSKMHITDVKFFELPEPPKPRRKYAFTVV